MGEAAEGGVTRSEPGGENLAGRHLGAGRFALTAVLGEGSQGATYEAVDKRDGKLVAVKRFQVRGARSWKDVELAEREARVLAQLRHPLLPAFIDNFEEDGALYLAMEKIEGPSLRALAGGVGRREEVLRFLHDAAEVLEYLHGRQPPVIHRDIKPGNVIRQCDPTGGRPRYVLVDFGAVRASLKPGAGSTVVGTFGYMAPEQFQGRALPASDVYGVGVTALWMLTDTEPEDLPHQGLAIDVKAALAARRDPALVKALERMLDPNPDTRAASVRELLAELGPRPPDPDPPGHATADEPGRAQRREHDERRRRRQARHEQRHARRAQRSAAGQGVRHRALLWSPLFTLLAVIGLSLARLGVSLTLRVLVPIVLTILSVVFGRGLIKAAREVRRAGRSASRVLKVAQDRVRGREPAATSEPATAGDREQAPPAGVRVDAAPDEPERVKGARIETREAEEEMRDALGEIEQAVQEAEAEVRKRS